ncbi:pyridoxal phosphate-dependent aminotransferase [Palleronia sp. LCG004]|uniref:pyridoxal phosphate-dependent aminotransferase n=1 Tax=Palleronia sp. LCG004 TaxID=3079304 RepID=UPI0029437964|nr:aminotransferase class I/II-fold pyridoxal phosphate-dependent enzyme [Palleronia sp. LCG004]WOI55170.1 aminotransferase class I/II-fold pyridoxal phosphate-dependent enzyme [Palleronia sp. LCG004]
MRMSRRGQVDPFIVMDVMERARAAEAEGRHIVHMEVGQPGTPAPKGARDALRAAMDRGPLGYTVALGLPELRSRIARHYGERYGVDLDPARVVVTAGASAGFVLAFSALFDAGDRVALGLPGYPSYRHILKAMSLDPVGIQTRMENRFQPVPEEIPEDAAGLILASPGNPAGTMLDKEALGALIEACAGRDVALISDEIYHGIDYERRPVSALELADDVYVVNSFSKYFSMTGWRIGWMVVPEAHVRMVERLAQNMFICPSHASQVAALASFDCREELEANLAVYTANREAMIEGLAEAGFSRFAPPDGAFYVYADVSDLTDDALALSAEILDEAGVAVTPGLDFDPDRGGRMLRFSYAGSTEEIAEGLARLKRWREGRRA